MKPKMWPPKDSIEEVIALFPDYGWTEVWIGYKYDSSSKKIKSWKFGFFPIGLPSHGCGCCADNDPTPTHWLPLPAKEQP